MSANRFDLEQAILELGHVVKHVQLLQEVYLTDAEPMTEDQVANHLMSVEYDLELRISNVWEVFKNVFEIDEYNYEAVTKKIAEAQRRAEFKKELEEYFGVPIEDEV